MSACRGSEATTQGVRVRVAPVYLPDQSDAEAGRFVFGYRIRITNLSEHTVKLLSRTWRIVDADGEENVVRGEGVVGEQPVLHAGETFEYSSMCPLETSWGTMEGAYRFRRAPSPEAGGTTPQGDEFDVRVARFIFVAPTARELSRN